jgi:hypothetical protein
MIRTLAILLMFMATPVAAETGRVQALDAGLSLQPRVHASLDWAMPMRAAGSDVAALNRLAARVQSVEVRLDTQAFVGRDARIYIVLPDLLRGMARADSLRVGWHARGRFNDGSLVAGQRTLLFAGRIDEDTLADVLDFVIHMDARDRDGTVHLEFAYEIELL